MQCAARIVMKNSRINKRALTVFSTGITAQVMAALLVIMSAVLVSVSGEVNAAQPAAESGYVIRLASSSARDFSAADVHGAGIHAEQAFYSTRFNRSGKQWRQLRLGFFRTRAEAESVLKKLAKHYPGAQVARATSADIRYASSEPVGAPAVVTRQPVNKAAKAGTSAESMITTTQEPSITGGLSRLSPTSWFKRNREKDVPEAGQAVRPANQLVSTAETNSAPVKTVDEAPRLSHKVAGPVIQESGGAVTLPAGAVGNDDKPLLSMFGKLSPAKWFSGNDRAGPDSGSKALQIAAVDSTAVAATVKQPAGGFDHLSTGFALDGAHADADCSSCHLQGVFEGTPSECSNCHGVGSRMSGETMSSDHIKTMPLCEECHTAQLWSPLSRMNHDVVTGSCGSCHDGRKATGKSPGHIQSADTCDDCHNTATWRASAFDHSGVATGSCFSCHNGSTATGKVANHVASSNTCDDCHTVNGWIPALFDHSGVSGNCASCHNGTTATGRSAAHISTTSSCESCHVTSLWTPVQRPDHTQVLGTCFSCHNGSTASGKSGSHITSGNTCDDCHSTVSWTNATFDHSGVSGNCASCHNGTTATGKNGTHIQTTNTCEDCHGTSLWRPVIRVDHVAVIGTCFSCHNGSTASGKTPNHISSGNTCDDCHSTSGWIPAVFDHSTVSGSCFSCHNGTTATGKNGTHIQTTNLCEDCHNSTLWRPVTRVDHADVIGTCFSCHNGTTASGKTPNHVASGNTCDDCHSTNGWIPAVFDHSAVSPGTCSTCHNGSTATGKPGNHVQTTGQCDNCHSTIAWLPATFDHNNVSPGTCSGCHNGNTATGKPGGHFVTTLQCDDCHSVNNWLSVVYQHVSGAYPGDHSGNPVCTQCHTANSQVMNWPAPAYQPDCAGCHASDYKAGVDKHQSLSLDRNCAGSCHQASPEHSVNSREW